MPTRDARKLGLAGMFRPDDFEDPRRNRYADEPADPPPDAPAPAASSLVGDLGLAGLLKKPLGVDPMEGFEGETSRAPPVEIEVEPPTIRPERGGGAPVAKPPPSATAAPPEPSPLAQRLGLGRMVPMVPGRPAAAPPAPARSPLVSAAGGAAPAAAPARRGDALGELLGSQRHDALVRDANSVGDALYGAFTRTRAAPAPGTNLAGEFGARRQVQEHEEDTDPTSERSRAMQALLGELQPGAFPPEMVAKLSRAQLKELFPSLIGIEKSRAARQAAIDKAAADRTNKLADLETARENKLTDETSRRGWQEERDRFRATEAEKRARIMAGQKDSVASEKRAVEEKEKYLEGYTLDPAASPKDTEVQKVREAQAATRTIQATAKEIADLYRKHGTQALPTAERARMQSLVTDLQLAMKGPEMFQLGVLAGPDMAILDRMVPDVTGAQANILDFLGGAQIIPKLEALESQVGRKFENKARALGYRKAGGGEPVGPSAPQRVRLKDGSLWERAPDGSAKRVE